MKKEAINTFGEGLIMDLHPLTTPSNVLVNCLNGTIITYNGNEFVLQNDMGNQEISTAKLPAGYVPVGMKEHGGIIYVAAHNPITGKSQIGSFPSPQQLYTGDNTNIAVIDFNFSELIQLRDGIPFIELEYYKQKLFEDRSTGISKEFHPGDKFIIISNSISEIIKQAIKDNILKLKLGVLNSEGTIEYLDESSLKTYDNNLWIYEGTEDIGDILKDNNLIQIFNSKCSGTLVLVIELNTFNSFNLLRKYSYDSDTNKIKVEMVGEMESDNPNFSGKTTQNENIQLLYNNQLESSITLSEQSSQINYSISPACPYGVLERMKKSGIIDFSSIRQNKEDFKEWRFVVSDTYVKIGWGYDYYNINEDSDIDKIVFTFINFADIPEDVQTTIGDDTYEITKDYFNGSFEDIIPFGKIKKNWVYVVRIDKYVNGEKSIIGYRLLYTGTFFNSLYSNNPDFTKLEKSDLNMTTQSKVEVLLSDLSNQDISIKSTTDSQFVEKDSITQLDYLKFPESDAEDTSNIQWTTKKKGTYTVEISPFIEYKDDLDLYAGTPESLNEVLTSPTLSTDSQYFENTPKYNSSGILTQYIKDIDSGGNLTWNSESKSFKGTLYTSRYVIANPGPIQPVKGNMENLVPLYRANMPLTQRDELYSFKQDGNVLYCASGDQNNIHYNSKILSEAHTNNNSMGPNAGSGPDNDGLNAAMVAMGNQPVGIFAGHSGDNASLKIESHRTLSLNNWRCSKDEVDDQDNFLIATWRDTNDRHWFINLISRKTESSDVTDQTQRIIRLEKMLNCFLSQMCVVQNSSLTRYLVGPDNSNIVYHLPFDTTFSNNIIISSQPITKSITFYLKNTAGEDVSITDQMNKWKELLSDKLVDFLPNFTTTIQTEIPVKISFGDSTTVDTDTTILTYYMNAYSYKFPTNSLIDQNGIDRGKIYIGETEGTANSDGSMNLKTQSNGLIKVLSSDDQLVDWKGNPVHLNYNINNRFINRYSLQNKIDSIEEGWNNYVLLRANAIYTVQGKWTKDKTNNAPDMAINVGFGFEGDNGKSLYSYE